jgi:amino acid transporter
MQQAQPGRTVRQYEPISAAPKPAVSVADAIALTIGIVIGAGIFRTPSLVAANASSESVVLIAWILGGLISFAGALVYAELATTYPHPGGDYHYLTRAYGKRLAFLFAWARISVIQTGSITFLAFVFGDYVATLLPLGEFSSAIYAALIVIVLTIINILGVRQGTGVQSALTILEVLGVVLIIVAGLIVAPAAQTAAPAAAAAPASSSFGFMMVLILLTYGGWNEAAYVSAELRDVKRNMVKTLLVSLLVITTLYVLVNLAYLRPLGLSGTAKSMQVAADVMGLAFGDTGAKLIGIMVAISALTSANASIFTGARTSYALGRDFSPFAFLGRWSSTTGTPVHALLIQGLVSLALVLFGALTRQGLGAMVDYTAPVFWFFFLLTGISLFVLRRKEPQQERPFRTPLFPVAPLLFCTASGYLLYSSLAYAGTGTIAGIAVLAAGALMLPFVNR